MINELEKEILILDEKIRNGNVEDIKNFILEKKTTISDAKNKLRPYDHVLLARHISRPKTIDFINVIIDNPIFLHGDRYFSDDESIIGGIGYLNGTPVTFIGTNKGKTLEENMKCRFGMPNPDGYRKALRLMKQAEKFNRPIITFIDTPGAYPGVDAENRGQAEAIAQNLMEIGSLNVPIISVFTGEGGSGGALALAIGDKTLMMEFSIFSILSPEGFASILWKDGSKFKEATEVMKLTAKDLLDYKIIDYLIEEDISFNIDDYTENFVRLKSRLILEMDKLIKENKERLIKNRFLKYRNIKGGY